jgi:hypothetical protein
MHWSCRYLLVLAAVSSWQFAMSVADVRSVFDPQSDLWNLSSLLGQFHALQSESKELDERQSILNRVHVIRSQVMAGLRAKCLTTQQAADRLVESAMLRARSGLSAPRRASEQTLRQAALSQLLGCVRQERMSLKGQPEAEVLERVEAELQAILHSSPGLARRR